MSIDDQRKKLDLIDDQILQLLAERMDLARTVASAKKIDGSRLRDRKREAELLARLQQGAREAGLPVDAVTRVYQEILNLSFHEQIAILSGSSDTDERVRIGYQGVPGAYSQWAGKRVGSARELVSQLERLLDQGRTTGFKTAILPRNAGIRPGGVSGTTGPARPVRGATTGFRSSLSGRGGGTIIGQGRSNSSLGIVRPGAGDRSRGRWQYR